MIEERSAGAVVFYSDDGRRFYLLLLNGDRLDLPKGQIEPGEDEMTAAQRETKEETGLELRFIEGFKKEIEYYYARQGRERVHKIVTFFLAESKNKEVRISSEHQGYIWLTYEDAVRRASYRSTRLLISSAENFIKKNLIQQKIDAK
ncbi:MAG: NUDIX domain-containing protein [Conexivisphaerales archaeon]